VTDWREELVEKMAREISRYNYDTPWQFFIPEARAALAVAEPVIREQCAGMADAIAKDYRGYRDHFSHSEPYTSEQIAAETAEQVAAAIREGGKDDAP